MAGGDGINLNGAVAWSALIPSSGLASADAANWSYNANNELVNYDGVDYAYDQNGNTVSKSVSGQVTAFAYNAKDRMEQVNLPDGRVATYSYDPFGRRISKTVDGVVTYFMYSDEGLAAEMTSAGVVTKTYGWRPDGTWGTDPVFMSEGGQTYYYHNDHLGTPWKLTDSNGDVVWSAAYSVFGEAAVDPASTIENNLRFPGQYFDVETGLHYNFHRYYDQETERYITADPIGLRGGVNLYGYVEDNPLNWVDPNGTSAYPPMTKEFWEWIADGGDQRGYTLAAVLLRLSLKTSITQSDRDNINSMAVPKIMGSTEYQELVMNIISKASDKSEIPTTYGSIVFNRGDLFYAIHKADITYQGHKECNGSWELYFQLHDTYNFEMWDFEFDKAVILNNMASEAQSRGLLHQFAYDVYWKDSRP